MMHGEGVFSWKDGREYRGNYVRDKKEGYGIFKWSDGRTYEGGWVNGKQHGRATYTNAKGEVKQGTWDQGKRKGEWIRDEDGQGTAYVDNDGKIADTNLAKAN